ncbi:SDR family NAD(P)-dependent oxidoreductase [Ralstonia pseudosolanacearum]|uniref:SDR family NAD(P)-dependent oxidoreductase n=1 Tax=Ralstonia pseudosolanacearum TaxID=1310165 RepID=UPI0022B1C880|nr:SDR family NAD(P)-dependent oxidoreductase [Ralstonia pseudosolanacearum]
MDIRDEASVQQGIETIISTGQRIDVLVNSAGVTLLGATEETSIAEAQALFDTNVFGILRTTQAALPHMRAQRSGRIINISSVLGFLPAPYMGLYSASKHAVEGMSETLDHEVRKFGIRVVLVEPSFTKTSLDINAPHAASKVSAYDASAASFLRRFKKMSNKPGSRWRRKHGHRCRTRCVEDAPYAQRRGLSSEQAAPFHAGRPGRLGSTQDVRTLLKRVARSIQTHTPSEEPHDASRQICHRGVCHDGSGGTQCNRSTPRHLGRCSGSPAWRCPCLDGRTMLFAAFSALRTGFPRATAADLSWVLNATPSPMLPR